jgi:tubulin polyglutamylase TTLL11
MIEVVRKVNLGRSLDTMRRLFPEEYDFHPRSWFLPQQFAEFCDAHRRASSSASSSERGKSPRPVYIVKPDEGSQGDGIYLIHEPHDYLFTGDKCHIVQVKSNKSALCR